MLNGGWRCVSEMRDAFEKCWRYCEGMKARTSCLLLCVHKKIYGPNSSAIYTSLISDEKFKHDRLNMPTLYYEYSVYLFAIFVKGTAILTDSTNASTTPLPTASIRSRRFFHSVKYRTPLSLCRHRSLP